MQNIRSRGQGSITRTLALLIVLVMVLAWTIAAVAAPRVRVVATTKLEVRGALTEAGIKIFGKLVDEAGVGLAGAQVYLHIASAVNPAAEVSYPPPSPPAHMSGGDIVLTTTVDGSFAVDVTLPLATYLVTARTDKTPWVARESHENLRIEPGKRNVELAFPPPPAPPSSINLDDPSVTFRVSVTADGIDQDGLRIELVDGGRVVASTTSGRGGATFTLTTSDFAPPGAREIAVHFAGNSSFTAARTSLLSHRAALARFHDVRAENPTGGIAADGIPLVGRVASASEIAASGVIEAYLGAERVGAARVGDRGSFRVVARWRAEQEGIATITLRFTAANEGWSTPDALDLPVRVRMPGPWRALSAVAAGLLLVGLLVRSRRAPRLAKHADQVAPDQAVRVTRKARAPKVIDLVVRDRRRRSPISGVRVRVSRPTAVTAELIGEGTSAADGRIRLVLRTSARAGDQLLATQRSFLPLAIELPRGAEVELAMTRRRDAVLDRLLTWGRTAIRLRLPTQATPAEVRSAAGRELREPLRQAVVAWSVAVEQAVFGASEMDEAGHRRIQDMAEGVTQHTATSVPPPPPPPGPR